jgi:ATP-dependent Clp endopeptidase proteolytic subunit ClpP
MAIRTKWYAIDANEDRAELSVFDEIGGWGIPVSEFKDQFDLVKDRKEIRLLLNSPGGAVTEGMAFYNLLASVRAKLTIEVIGLAASIASIIALAGRELVMDEGTYFMIHNPWTITWGDADQLRKDAAVLDKMRGELVNIYVAHSSLTAKEVGEMMDEETWLTADETKRHGFADRVQRETRAAALAFDVNKIGFRHPPRALIGRGDFKDVKSVRDFERFLRDAGASRADAEAIASKGWPKERGDPAAHLSDIDLAAVVRAAANTLK